MPIIGHISLAKDMKAALQEADEEGDGKVVQRDAKGREILSPEEKARRDEKARKAAVAHAGEDAEYVPQAGEVDTMKKKKRYVFGDYTAEYRLLTLV